MSKREDELMEQLRSEKDEVQISDSLKPEQIEKMLSDRSKKHRWKKGYTIGLAAACCLLACGVAWGVQNRHTQDATIADSSVAKGDEQISSGIQTARDYDEVYRYLQKYQDAQNDIDTGVTGREVMTESADASTQTMDTGSTGAAKAAGSTTGNTSFSETNVRQEGVDEADVVKTDGRYLYTLTDNSTSIGIADTANGKLKSVGSISLGDDDQIHEFYVNDGKLILIGETDDEKEEGAWSYYFADTKVVTYDVTDPANPEKQGEVKQCGYYTSSRMVEGYLYLFTQYSANAMSDITVKDKKDYIPYVNDELLDAGDIYLPPFTGACMYEVVSSVNMQKPDEVQQSKAIFSSGGELYVSNDNIYWYETRWDEDIETVIRRISYRNGELKAEASGKVDGYINDSFSIDEYDGYLRVVTTNDESNGLYILNSDMKEVGSITGLAKDERVYSARFMGETGYFVTYKETDPLFSVDLSDPKKPKIIGELKIPGFSEYLHFYGDHLLLGIGMDVDEDGFTTEGVKLSMFDISDNSDVKEVQKYTMENVYSADVMYNYRSALIDPDKNVIGFAADGNNGELYYVFSYDADQGFQCLMKETVNGNSYQAARGVYIDNVLYVVKGNVIEAYRMGDYQKVDDVIL